MTVPVWTKSELLKNCVFDLDDAYFKYDRNALSELFYLKTLYPKMKVTLFVVSNHPDSPFIEMKRFITLLKPLGEWVELACHGWEHKTPIEAQHWTNDEINHALDKWEEFGQPPFIQRGFKAPGWQISNPTYQVLKDRGYWVADHVYNEERRPKELKVYTLNHPWCYHGHTWDVPNADPLYKNGIRQLLELHTIPWDQETNFYFVSEIVTNR